LVFINNQGNGCANAHFLFVNRLYKWSALACLVVVKLKGRKLNSKGRVPISIRRAIQEEPQLLKISDFSPYGTLLEVLSEDK
jgi:hypothetical protein